MVIIIYSIIIIVIGIFILFIIISSSAKEKIDIQNKIILCRDCIYYFSNPDDYGGYHPYCDHPSNTKTYRNPRSGNVSSFVDFTNTDFRYNKNNDCKYYKRKWWKF